jgi:hypothetical protein
LAVSFTETCGKCGQDFDRHKGFAGIHTSVGATALEQLRNGRAVFLCNACGEKLREWLRGDGE